MSMFVVAGKPPMILMILFFKNIRGYSSSIRIRNGSVIPNLTILNAAQFSIDADLGENSFLNSLFKSPSFDEILDTVSLDSRTSFSKTPSENSRLGEYLFQS